MTQKSAETFVNSETNIENKYDDGIFRSEQDELLTTTLQVDATIAIAVDFDIDVDAQVSAVPTTDMIFAAAVRGLLEGVVAAVQLTMASSLEHEGDLRFPRDLEPLVHEEDCNGVTLDTKSKEKPSKHLGYRHSGSSSRASSRAASRFGGSTTVSVALKHSAALTMKLAKLSVFPASVSSSKVSDPFRIKPWSEQPTTNTPANATASASGYNEIDWAVEEDYATPPSSLISPTTSRFSTDFNEMQRRQEISTELDFREARERIQGEVHRKGGVKLKLRSIADPTISLEKEERLAATTRANSRRSLFRPLATAETRKISSSKSSLRPEHKLASSVPSTTTLPIPESLTFRQEDYDGLQSDVVVLETNGELLVGENCFLVAKKQRSELLEDLFQQSTINPRIQLPHAPQEEEFEATFALQGSPQLGVKDERLPSRQSPERRAVSRNSLGRRKPTAVGQDAVFEGQQGSFAAFPKLELDPSKTLLAKGVTLKVNEANGARKRSVHDEANGTRKRSVHDEHPNLSLLSDPFASTAKKHNASKQLPAASKIPEHTQNAALENQLDVMLLKQDLRKRSIHSLNDLLSSENQQQSVTTKHSNSKPEKNANKSRVSKHAHHSQKDLLQSLRTRTPAYKDRPSRRALPNDFMGVKSEFDDASDDKYQLYSLKENGPTSLPKVKYLREFLSPPQGHIQVIHPAKAKNLTGPASPRSFPFATLPAVLQAKR